MDNSSHNSCTAGRGVPFMQSFSQDSAIFLIIVLVTTGFNLLIVAALIADTKTNLSIQVILVNFLLSGVVSYVVIIIYDSSVLSDPFASEEFSSMVTSGDRYSTLEEQGVSCLPQCML